MAADARTSTLTGVPALPPLLARGALLSPFKRPRPDAEFPRTRLVLPGLRADLARLAAYERVCGLPAGAPTLPLTYPHVMGFPLAMRLMSGRDFPLPLLGLVHTSLTVTRHAAMPAGAAHELTVRIAGLAPHRRGTEATVITEARTGGTVIWESSSTYLARHRTAPDAGGHDETEARERPRDETREEAREVRAVLPVRGEWRVGGDLGRRYGAASGDRNPIHLHPLTARLFGFPRTVAHGMWTVARCLAEHGVPEAVTVRALFRAPVLLPGTVLYAAEGGRFALLGPGEPGRTHLTGEVYPA
ncbi:MaoC family dehydratase [Streptomyces sp. CRN 30]|uniref:MaoC family dehydratase n=1 Tax=Streptomyces sp. CRN 30 TaxID=3075613 RepID=UPI002A7EE6F4|nr:MaoC/PaaZ C-terminal domain-containing protein [Streptomyces sp. CRN 30]